MVVFDYSVKQELDNSFNQKKSSNICFPYVELVLVHIYHLTLTISTNVEFILFSGNLCLQPFAMDHLQHNTHKTIPNNSPAHYLPAKERSKDYCQAPLDWIWIKKEREECQLPKGIDHRPAAGQVWVISSTLPRWHSHSSPLRTSLTHTINFLQRT